MAFLKTYRYVRQYGLGRSIKKGLKKIPGYMGKLYLWRVRRCQCCGRITIFLTNSSAEEFGECLFCSANLRYELLAIEIKNRFGQELREKDVLELDPHSPLKNILSGARSYTRSFYETGRTPGSSRVDGARCEDIMALTFQNETFDLIVSSDVLEHVPVLEKAFSETARVLRPGGCHLFTVPPRAKTKRRAEIIDGKIQHIEAPDYHLDPLSPQGILAFWDVGPDLPQLFSSAALRIGVSMGPCGRDRRVVWIAERSAFASADRNGGGPQLPTNSVEFNG
jgi:SAM-dependent methyltransferase